MRILIRILTLFQQTLWIGTDRSQSRLKTCDVFLRACPYLFLQNYVCHKSVAAEPLSKKIFCRKSLCEQHKAPRGSRHKKARTKRAFERTEQESTQSNRSSQTSASPFTLQRVARAPSPSPEHLALDGRVHNSRRSAASRALPQHPRRSHQSPWCRSQLSALSSQVSALRSQLSALSSQVSGLSSQLSGLSSQLSALRSQLSALRSQVSALSPPQSHPGLPHANAMRLR